MEAPCGSRQWLGVIGNGHLIKLGHNDEDMRGLLLGVSACRGLRRHRRRTGVDHWAEHGAVVPDQSFSFQYANEADSSVIARLSPSVLNYTSISSIIPEPPAWVLAAIGIGALSLRTRVVRQNHRRAIGQRTSDSNRLAAFATTA